MRGDSRRDFYAKALALCGLGVLGGFGAVVDYWPVAIRFPATQSPVVSDVSVVPASVPADAWARVDQVVNAAGAVVPDVTRVSVQREARANAHARVPASSLPSSQDLVLPVALLGDAGATVARLDAPVPVLLPVIDRRRPPSVATEVVTHLQVPPPHAPGPAGSASVAADLDERGVFGSAVRVTGRSLARSGAATGASLAGAFRFVGGVFRRALPD